MKHFFGALCFFGLLGGLVLSALAADQTWEGQISDSLCGSSHSKMIAEKYPALQTSSGAPKQDCTLACIKAGGQYVFVTDGKVYKIANQNIDAIVKNAGASVELTGNMRGDTITVSKIAPSAEK